MEEVKDNTEFPHADAFTFVPELYAIISRLSLLKTSHVSTTGLAISQTTQEPSQAANIAQTQTQSSNTAQLTNTISHESRESRTSEIASAKGGEPIEIKDLAANIYPVRQAILRAKEVIRNLPDIQRSVEEQQSEIGTLEAEITALKERMAILGRIAEGKGRADTQMQGVE